MFTTNHLVLPADVTHTSVVHFSGTLADVSSYDEMGALLTVEQGELTLVADAEWVAVDHGSTPGEPVCVHGSLTAEARDGRLAFGIAADDWEDHGPHEVTNAVGFEARVDDVDLRRRTMTVWHAVELGHWERWTLALAHSVTATEIRSLRRDGDFRFDGRFATRDLPDVADGLVVEIDTWLPL